MARVWFARRQSGRWIVPGGRPAYERPLSTLLFRLDLGTHRKIKDDGPTPASEVPAEEPERLERVIVETTPDDVREHEFSGYSVGFYDSPYSPREVARRLG